MCSAGILTAFDQEGNIFSICCNTGAFLLDFPKFIVTTNLFHASFTDIKPVESRCVTVLTLLE